MSVVSNAGPLIYLSLLGHFAWLHELFGSVVISEAVYSEVVVEGRGKPGAGETETACQAGWLRRAIVADRLAIDLMTAEMHVGEAETIVLAREQQIDRVLMDDRLARQRAKNVGLRVTGTVGILLLARSRGFQVQLKRDLDMLTTHHFRISERLYSTLLSDWGDNGETPKLN